MLVNAMEVSGVEGTYRATCEKVMRVLRDNRDSLLSMLEAFIHDPLVSWRLLGATPDFEMPDMVPAETTSAAMDRRSGGDEDDEDDDDDVTEDGGSPRSGSPLDDDDEEDYDDEDDDDEEDTDEQHDESDDESPRSEDDDDEDRSDRSDDEATDDEEDEYYDGSAVSRATPGRSSRGGSVARSSRRRSSQQQQQQQMHQKMARMAANLSLNSTRYSAHSVHDTSSRPHLGSVVSSIANSRLDHRSARERELVQTLGEEGVEAPIEALNEKAVAVMARVEDKLTGCDFDSSGPPLSVADQVDRLIHQATDVRNLCQAFVGWCPFW